MTNKSFCDLCGDEVIAHNSPKYLRLVDLEKNNPWSTYLDFCSYFCMKKYIEQEALRK